MFLCCLGGVVYADHSLTPNTTMQLGREALSSQVAILEHPTHSACVKFTAVSHQERKQKYSVNVMLEIQVFLFDCAVRVTLSALQLQLVAGARMCKRPVSK